MFCGMDAEGNGSCSCITFHVEPGQSSYMGAIFVNVFSGVLAEQKLGG